MGLLQSIKNALFKQTNHQKEAFEKVTKQSRQLMSASLQHVLNREFVDDSFYNELERALIKADVPPKLVKNLLEAVKNEAKKEKVKLPQEVLELTVNSLVNHYNFQINQVKTRTKNPEEPHVILVVGVNGVGKTTSIAKMAKYYVKEENKVLLVAADTFRAGAVEQLNRWGIELNIPVISNPHSNDPASVIFEGMKKTKESPYDVVICDTAGRLQSKVNLMNELGKLSRVIQKTYPFAPHEVLLVIDASLGQNGLIQASSFAEVVPISGVILTKMDGTSKGGIALAIASQLHVPILWMGVGETINDLEQFDINLFVSSLFDLTDKEEPHV